jgi:hypothetical protein
MLKKLFVLFVFLIAVSLIKKHHDESKVYNLVRLDIRTRTIVDKNLTVFIPMSLKFGDELVNEKKQGVLKLYVKGEEFQYIRPLDVPRNEYFLQGDTKNVELTEGDEIVIKFSQSNMPKTENVVLFGQVEVKK